MADCYWWCLLYTLFKNLAHGELDLFKKNLDLKDLSFSNHLKHEETKHLFRATGIAPQAIALTTRPWVFTIALFKYEEKN